MKFDPDQIARALRKSWVAGVRKTMDSGKSGCWAMQCHGLLVHELFGGELLKTTLPEGKSLLQSNWWSAVGLYRQPVHCFDCLLRRACNAR
jgi:hypothetical protein